MRKKIHLLIFTIILIFTAYEELSLRAYLYKHAIHPFFIADALPNFLAVLLLSFIFTIASTGQHKTSALKSSTQAFIAMSLYEFAQIWIPGRTFDIQDIIASLLAAIFSYVLLKMIDACVPA
jgi:VanZ family protein